MQRWVVSLGGQLIRSINPLRSIFISRLTIPSLPSSMLFPDFEGIERDRDRERDGSSCLQLIRVQGRFFGFCSYNFLKFFRFLFSLCSISFSFLFFSVSHRPIFFEDGTKKLKNINNLDKLER